MNNNYFNNGYSMGASYGSNVFNPYGLMNTNVVRVTSLEEAIMQTTKRPSDMVYFNQDKDEFYNVKIDHEGRKTWATFTYTLPNPDTNIPASRAEVLAITSRLEALEAKLGGAENVEPNG